MSPLKYKKSKVPGSSVSIKGALSPVGKVNFGSSPEEFILINTF
jgi:hypothetical protein